MAVSTTFVANKKRRAELICWILRTSACCHITPSDIMDGLSGMIGVSSSSLASFHLDHVMRGLKWPVSCSNPPTLRTLLCTPPPSPPCRSPPAGRKDPLLRLEWLLLGLLSCWRRKGGVMGRWAGNGREGGSHRPGEHCQPPTRPSHCPPSSPHPALRSSVLTYPPPTCRQDSSAACVCIRVCVRTCHSSPYGLLWCMHVSRCRRACVVVSGRFFVCVTCE